ncbi:hypothetical protein DL764_010566 [Monosporascus ibericus]|uniref:Fibronectin type-III domain-containing protein n=1 Tax=Monosporascus ibericus TaxID=155417 RepID=A0A4Q4SSI4_9PEZI|nr:hypothetical protein DL764_010566 [Monosporascus ibericus]
MRTVTRALVAVALFTAVEACVQAHNYLNNRWSFKDIMSMEVYVSGHVVCRGGDAVEAASADTVFCLRNHDGKGSGCAPGYDGQSIWRKELDVKKSDSNVFDCGTEEVSLRCLEFETCLQVQDISCPEDSCETCDYRTFCNQDPINPPNPFPYLPPPPPPPKPFKAMIVGDSITHGMEGDFTWRWRLFYWVQDVLGSKVDFVGPWKGTKGPISRSAVLPQPPAFPGDSAPELPETTGAYHGLVPAYFGVTSEHASWWGRQAAQSKDTIRAWVEEHQPEYLLVLLGFNDLGWWISGPEDLAGDMGQLVDNARKGKPDIKILLGNVVDRTFIRGRQDLVDNTSRYNQLLRERMEGWFRYESPLVYVDVNANYNCRPHGGCPDGYDGLHPNSMGEYHIAQSFARSLKEHFGFIGPDFVVPSNPEPREISTPTNVLTSSWPEGLRTSWDLVSGARGYDIRTRLQGMSGWWTEGPVYPDSAASWTTWVVSGQTWEIQVRTRGDNDHRSDWSPITSATADVQTAPGPPNIVVVPSGDGLQVSWGAVHGYDVNRYGVIIWDKDEEGAFIDTRGVSGTSLFIGGLMQGHRYSTWVATWVNLNGGIAGGLPAAGRDVIGGGGAPAPPGNLRITNMDATTVELRWDASAGASGYGVYVYVVRDGSPHGEAEHTPGTTYGIGFLFPGTWNYRYCVSAFNGNLESSRAAVCVVPPVYPGYEKRDVVEGDGTLATNTSTVYNATTMMEDKDLPTLFNLLMVQASKDASTPISNDVVNVA